MTDPTPQPTLFQIEVNDDVSPYGSAPDTTTLIAIGSVAAGLALTMAGCCYYAPCNTGLVAAAPAIEL